MLEDAALVLCYCLLRSRTPQGCSSYSSVLVAIEEVVLVGARHIGRVHSVRSCCEVQHESSIVAVVVDMLDSDMVLVAGVREEHLS